MENKKNTQYLFTSEVVSPGHPDKCADIIADTIVDKLIISDSKSRVASEVFVAGKHVVIGGEVTSHTQITTEDYKQIVHFCKLFFEDGLHDIKDIPEQSA